MRLLILSVSILFLAGCITIPEQHSKKEENYRQQVQEQVKQVAGEFQGGNFPFYHWSSPIVQQVRVPAHISNGVMIPEHDELVIIKPGQWVEEPAYPIQAKKRTEHENQISYMDVSDLSFMPRSLEHAAIVDPGKESANY